MNFTKVQVNLWALNIYPKAKKKIMRIEKLFNATYVSLDL